MSCNETISDKNQSTEDEERDKTPSPSKEKNISETAVLRETASVLLNEAEKSENQTGVLATQVYEFFAPRSLHRIKIIIVDPDQITDFVGLIYDQQEQLCINTLPISRDDFIRMCKTLVLKRVQDVYEKCFNQRAAHFIRLYTNFFIPKPLYDLMSAIGSGYDGADGCHYYMSPVAQPATNPPSYWTIDAAILNNYIQFTRRMAFLYHHVEFPSSNDFEGRAIGCTRVQVHDDGLHSVLSSTPNPTPTDGLLRMMNPDAFLTGEVPDIAFCGFRLCNGSNLVAIRNAFIGSAVLFSNA